MSILFFAHDPGGANAISPLISHFSDSLVFGKGPALQILPGAEPLPENVLEKCKPNFLVTGTSAADFSERYLWREASTFGVQSMAILDQWVNYGVRFSKYSSKNVHLFDGVCEYLPVYICVMDEFAKCEMAKDGVPPDRIVTLGNPHFETIHVATKVPSPTCDNNTYKNRIVLFASEPFEDIYRAGAELIALSDLIKITKDYNDIEVRIRKHPREPDDKFVSYLSERIKLDENTDAFESIRQSEIIISVSSMLLIEAMFFGKKIISYQPKSKDGKNDFILTRNGMLPFVQCFQEFRTLFYDVLDGHTRTVRSNIAHDGIIDNVTQFIKERVYG